MLTIALFVAYLGAGDQVMTARTASDDQVRAAIVAAVRQRMGNDIDVAVEDLVVQMAPGSAVIEAVPDPSARLDGQIRFVLRWVGTARSGARVVRAGAAVARVRVTTSHAHATTLIARGKLLRDSDVVNARHEIVSGPLRPLPTAADSVGTKTLRPLAPDACIVRGAIVERPDVRSGEEVVAIAHINGVEAHARMRAADSGVAGSIIRVVNQQSRRALRARVVSPGMVEILK